MPRKKYMTCYMRSYRKKYHTKTTKNTAKSAAKRYISIFSNLKDLEKLENLIKNKKHQLTGIK